MFNFEKDIAEKNTKGLNMDYNREEIRKKFKELFEHSLQLIYVNDLNGNFLDANDITLLTLGYEREDIGRVSFIDLVDQEDLIKAYRVTKEIRKTGKQSKMSEYKIKTKDGNYIYVETYGIPLLKDGKIYAILGIANNITQKKIAEQKLKDSEEMFRAIYKEGPIPAYTWQKLGEDVLLIDFNHEAEKLSLGNVKNYIGEKASKIYEDRPDMFNYLKECMNEKIHLTAEYKYKFELEEEEKYILANYGYVNPNLVVEHAEDITEIKRTEEKFRASELKYRNMINNLDVGFYQVTIDGKMINHNRAHNIILGYDPNETLVDRNVKIFWQDPDQRDIYLAEILEKGYARNYECHAITKGGKRIVVELNSHLIYDNDGTPIQIDGTFKDITEKYVLSQKLKQSEEKFRHLYENTPLGIVLINSQGVIVDCNNAIEQITDYNKDEIIGKKFFELNAIHPESASNVLSLFKRFIQGETMHRIDFRLFKKDKEIIWVNLQASLIEIGKEFYVQAIFSDISAAKEAEFLINEEVKKLKELDKIRKNLISRVSHELKTPLVSIMGGSELLQSLYKDRFEEEQLELLGMIAKGGKRLKMLIDSLIDISKIEYERFRLHKELEDLSDIVKDCVKELSYLFKERNISLSLSLPDSLLINLDKIRIEQVVINLLSNAIKNTHPNGRVEIILQKMNNAVVLIVSDDGIGLTKDEMDVLFTRFGKIERYGEGFEYLDIQGTGLGLFISKEIVELHNGEIRAESEGRNNGSRFIVKLPIELGS